MSHTNVLTGISATIKSDIAKLKSEATDEAKKLIDELETIGKKVEAAIIPAVEADLPILITEITPFVKAFISGASPLSALLTAIEAAATPFIPALEATAEAAIKAN